MESSSAAFSKLGTLSFIYNNFYVQRKAASDKQAQPRLRNPPKMTSSGDYGLDDSLQNSDTQAHRPKRSKRPTKSVNENLEPAFTGPHLAIPEQTHVPPVSDSVSGVLRAGQDI